MVHGLVQQSGGSLRLLSRLGTGTTAELWFPVTEAPVPSHDSGTVSQAQDLAHHAAWDILAVDDDELVLSSTVETLKDMGHRVQSARSALEALNRLAEQRFDMMISDHAMPHMTGAQLAASVRERWPDMPVILVSGDAQVITGLPVAIPRLAKPFSRAQLMDVMSAVVQKTSHRS
jgi:DNA-binding NtrC family response regulator